MVSLMPIPLKFAGAHTMRLSGDWRLNVQNLPRGGELRKALLAPPGHMVVVGDLSQIEARLCAWFCQAEVLFSAFAQDQDPYVIMAAHIFAREIDPKVDKFARSIGKAAVLGLQYGMGADKFYSSVLSTARAQEQDMAQFEEWTPELAKQAVKTYRRVNHPIPAMWQVLTEVLNGPWKGLAEAQTLGPITIGHGYVEGPGGLRMLYDNPREEPGQQLIYDYGGVPSRIWAGHFLENVIQFLARQVIMHAALRLAQRGLRFVHQAHDELSYIVPKKDVDETKRIVLEEMVRRPSWAPTLPLKAEVGSGLSYGESK